MKLFFCISFDDTNTRNLLEATKGHRKDVGFNFDANSIDWTDYRMNAHIPGLVKYGMKQIERK